MNEKGALKQDFFLRLDRLSNIASFLCPSISYAFVPVGQSQGPVEGTGIEKGKFPLNRD